MRLWDPVLMVRPPPNPPQRSPAALRPRCPSGADPGPAAPRRGGGCSAAAPGCSRRLWRGSPLCSVGLVWGGGVRGAVGPQEGAAATELPDLTSPPPWMGDSNGWGTPMEAGPHRCGTPMDAGPQWMRDPNGCGTPTIQDPTDAGPHGYRAPVKRDPMDGGRQRSVGSQRYWDPMGIP